jgi:hypothetical protein
MKDNKGLIIGIFLGLFLLTRKKANANNSSGTPYIPNNGSLANFNMWVAPGTRRRRRIDAGYTLLPNWDSGHWTGGSVGQGVKVGTNMSISAPVYLAYKRLGDPNYVLTEQKMRDMTEAEALDIYKKNYWDKIRGSEIKSQLIANFTADMKSSGGGVWNLQKALNSLGASPTLAEDGSLGTLTLTALNNMLDSGLECEINNAFRTQQILYYQSLSNQSQNWYDSLNLDYPQLIC